MKKSQNIVASNDTTISMSSMCHHSKGLWFEESFFCAHKPFAFQTIARERLALAAASSRA